LQPCETSCSQAPSASRGRGATLEAPRLLFPTPFLLATAHTRTLYHPGSEVAVTASFFRDMVRSLRSWRRTPGSALLVVLALGLSGGALLTLASLFNALFWRELPVSHPEELVGVSAINARVPGWQGVPASVLASLDRTANGFQASAGFDRLESTTAVINNTSHRVAIEGVSGRYFETLGVAPALGRVVGAREVDRASPVATISFRCWQTRFGADRRVIGQTFRLQGELMTVIGVAPRVFTGLEVGMPTDAWVPASLVPGLLNEPPGPSFFDVLVGRLRPGVTLQQAASQVETLWPPAREVAAGAAAASPEFRDAILALQPQVESAARGFSAAGYRAGYRRTLLLLVLSSAITLVLSCANLSGLLLARWSAREADLAVQAALGASNGRLASQVVGESLALSMVAVVLSAPLALWSAKSLTLLLWNQPDISSPLDLSPDYRVLGVMVGLAGLVAVCVSLLPASRIWSAKLMLTRGTRGLPGRSVTRWGRWLAAAQVALAVPLLVTAWVVAVNLHRLEGVTTGFQPEGVVVVNTTNQAGIAPAADPVAYLTQLVTALRADPGIVAAALSRNEPVSRSSDWFRRPITGNDGLRSVRSFVEQVSPGYFETLSVPLVAGRDFTWTDDHGKRDVAIISTGLGKALFPGADPVGRRVRLGGPDRLMEVIGVVADAKLAEPHATSQLFLFTPLLQEPPRSLELNLHWVLLRSPLAPNAVEALARRTIIALGREDVVEVHPVQHTLDAALLRERVMRLGAIYFAGLTTLLVFVGLYAVLNLGIMRRIPEIGLRLALGASAHDIRMTVIREAFVTAAAGLVVGVPVAFVSGRLIASSLTLVGSHDALAFGAGIGLTVAITVLSVLIPLRRAGRITPLEALGSQ
jgi:predicted permease